VGDTVAVRVIVNANEEATTAVTVAIAAGARARAVTDELIVNRVDPLDVVNGSVERIFENRAVE
jgi:hypothetical protein